MITILLSIICFLLFACTQAIVINGIFETFGKGMILNGYAEWVKRNLNEYWQKPFVSCIKCLSSVFGTITFWITFLSLFGFNWFEVWMWICDIFILVYLNFYFYKKI